ASLPVEGADSVTLLDSTSIMEIDHVPSRLAIVGGGPIGLEFGQMFRRFGSEVTIIDRSPRIASQEDEAISAALMEIFQEDGIEILTGASVEEVNSPADGGIDITVGENGQSHTVSADVVLAAIGRTPNSDRLHLDAAGIATDDAGYITVNDRLETSQPGIYAIGDINGGPAFTHVSYDDFRILAPNLLEDAGKSRAGRPVAYTMFTDPQLGRIGLTEQQARDRGKEIHVFEMPMSSVARAIETDETRGLMRAVVDRESERIL
ncbi:MAG: FAD-dependent oxidoreductase, partial [Chloroflexota bacterium]